MLYLYLSISNVYYNHNDDLLVENIKGYNFIASPPVKTFITAILQQVGIYDKDWSGGWGGSYLQKCFWI